jgi:hypothetical protein
MITPRQLAMVLVILMTIVNCNAQFVSIGGNKFYVNGNEIFFNGVNTAWQRQTDYSLDFLGRNFDYNWWNAELQRYVDNRINLARIWIHGSGNYSPSLNGDGMVTGATSQFWSHMDQLVALARQKKIYIMPTFWSFDMVKDQGSAYYNQYRQIINDPNKTQWYIDYFLKPFLQRYENEPYVMGYDICNEPEHMWRDANCGYLNRNNVVRFVAMCAAAINQNSTKPVTVGSMWIIFNSSKYGGWDQYAGNNYSNASLMQQYNNPNAYLDFWSPHWYQWQSSGGPFQTSIGNWMDDGSRPTLIGETPGYDVTPSMANNCCSWNITMANYYLQSHWNGYAGVCAWKNPHENDGYGTFNSISVGTNAFYNQYPNLVYPNTGSGISSGGTYRIMARHSNKALDVVGGSTATGDGIGVHQWEYVNGTNQRWTVTSVGSGYYRLTAVHSGKALEVANWYVNNGAAIVQRTYSGGANQQWLIESVGGSYYRVVNRYSGKALDVNGGTSAIQNGAIVHQWDYLGATNQQWQFVPVSSSASTEMISVDLHEEEMELNAYPNPFREEITIPIRMTEPGTVSIRIYTASGQSIYEKAMQLDKGLHLERWKPSKGKAGLFVVSTVVNGRQRNEKVLLLE